jgi:hypothetical protein
MRKQSIWLGVGLIIVAFTADLSGQMKKILPRGGGDLIVQSVNIILPSGTGCTIQWSATIINKGVELQKSITVQAYQVSSDGYTKPAGSQPLGKIGPGETITTQPVPFDRSSFPRSL